MARNSTPVILSSPDRDYEYDTNNDVFLFYPSRPAFESSRDDLFPPYPTGFYNLPVFRNDREYLPLPLRPTESVYSDYTAATYSDEDFHGTEGEVLRAMGYSSCLCLGLISVGVPISRHPTATQGCTISLCNFFEKLWDRFLRR